MNSRGPVAGVGRPGFGDDRLGLVVAAGLSERPRNAAGVVIDAGTGWKTLEAITDEPLLVPCQVSWFVVTRFIGSGCSLDRMNAVTTNRSNETREGASPTSASDLPGGRLYIGCIHRMILSYADLGTAPVFADFVSPILAITLRTGSAVTPFGPTGLVIAVA